MGLQDSFRGLLIFKDCRILFKTQLAFFIVVLKFALVV